MIENNPSENTPWHKQFWPWFLISLPGTIIIASLATVYVAFKGADDLISDNYYRDGLAINQVIEQDRAASALSLAADVRFDLESGEIFVLLTGDSSGRELQISLLHPFEKDLDKTIFLKHLEDGRYRADLEFRPAGRYYVRLTPRPDADWRLNGDIEFDKVQELRLESL